MPRKNRVTRGGAQFRSSIGSVDAITVDYDYRGGRDES